MSNDLHRLTGTAVEILIYPGLAFSDLGYNQYRIITRKEFQLAFVPFARNSSTHRPSSVHSRYCGHNIEAKQKSPEELSFGTNLPPWMKCILHENLHLLCSEYPNYL